MRLQSPLKSITQPKVISESSMGGLPGVVALLIALKCAASFLLSKLNRSEVSKYKSNPPTAVLAVMDKETYEKSVAYTLVNHALKV